MPYILLKYWEVGTAKKNQKPLWSIVLLNHWTQNSFYDRFNMALEPLCGRLCDYACEHYMALCGQPVCDTMFFPVGMVWEGLQIIKTKIMIFHTTLFSMPTIGESELSIVPRFWGMFFFVFESSQIIGNLISSLVFQQDTSLNANSSGYKCGADDCYIGMLRKLLPIFNCSEMICKYISSRLFAFLYKKSFAILFRS